MLQNKISLLESFHVQPEMQPDGKVFYYKMVAKLNGKYYSIYDGKTEYILGSTMHQEAIDDHKGGFYVYSSVDQVVFADIPYKKGGLYIAPRTVLKCLCWGKYVEYGNGKLAFSFICPVQDLGLPQGYKASKTAIKEALKRYEDKVAKQQQKRQTQNQQQTHAAHAEAINKYKIRPHSAAYRKDLIKKV